MPRPKHLRCQVCNEVTSRYVRTVNQGPFSFKVWERDPARGQVTAANGTKVWCRQHAPNDLTPAR